MEDKVIEQIIANAIGIGTIQTLKELGLLEETVTAKQAYKMYGEKRVKEWRHKRWIVGYPSGNTERARYCFKRSELETAARMLSIQNIIPPNKINEIMSQNQGTNGEAVGRKPNRRGPVLR